MGASLGLTSLYGMRTETFSELASFSVREVLVVASLYDAFAFEEDGQLNELVTREYRNLDLTMRHVPRFTLATTGEQALQLLAERSFDMVVSSAKLPDCAVGVLAGQMRERHPGLSVAVLAAHAWELPGLEEELQGGAVDALFLWQGDARTLLAALLLEEDRRNAAADIARGVQAILLVEDDTRFLSLYLPAMVTEVTRQTARMVAEGINPMHRLLRLHARPKILLARSFEQAWDLWNRYRDNLLGVLSDVSFPRQGHVDPQAGLALFQAMRAEDGHIPVMLQSSDVANAHLAHEIGAPFVHKLGATALAEVSQFFVDHLGFGDFVFRLPDGREVDRARTIRECLTCLRRVDLESLVFHAKHNHFSRWFAARTEIELATALRAHHVDDASDNSNLRALLADTVEAFLQGIQRHTIADFSIRDFDETTAFAKLGAGSLGGKGRGLAFIKRLLSHQGLGMPEVDVTVPQTAVVASEVFERFMAENGLWRMLAGLETREDRSILDAFRQGRFPRDIRADLAHLLDVVREPLAIRSSSILEDSPYQPFAGVYATLMLPNNHPSLDVRLAQLIEGLKVVYASTYMRQARAYLATTPHRLEEERMAVLIQRLVGRTHGTRFYPLVSGVASSYNFYPFQDILPEDGVAHVALGLGKAVVEGLESLRFCPRHPTVLPQFSDTRDILKNAQRRFWALDLGRSDVMPGLDLEANILELDASQAFADGGLGPISSTYNVADDHLWEGLERPGTPLITFARLLGNRDWAFPAAISSLLARAQGGIGRPVEIEFALQLEPASRPALSVLQVRPLVVEALSAVDVPSLATGRAIVVSPSALGHGRMGGVRDLVVVLPSLNRARTRDVAAFIDAVNQELRLEGRPYALVGPGRWGSRDPWLGIPVTWSQISGARAIVETDFADLSIEPSQGSHFFHNLTAFGVSYLAVHDSAGGGTIDWNWFAQQPAVRELLGGHVRHIRVPGVEILVDGARREGVMHSLNREQTP